MIQEGKDIIQDGMMGYSAYVLLQRAIPSLYDGLKISYRRILYSMYKSKINNFTKSQNIAGEVAKIHPHSSVYNTMVGMAQSDRHIHPFIDGKGYFGEYTSRDVTAAAERYTNVKMNDFGKYLLKDINKGQIAFSPSYDGTQMLPDLLPVKFPIVLAFAQSGMGVGFSSTTSSFNVGEIADNVIQYLTKDKLDNLIPDFATGGILIKNDDIINGINTTGRGSLRIRGKAIIEDNSISITEIPYSTTREAIIDKVVELAKSEKLKEVVNIQDLTGLNKMEILVTARKGTDMNLLLQKLYKLTPLESTYSVNNTLLYEDRPQLLGVKEVIKKWVNWRLNCVKKEINYDILQLEKERIEIDALEKINSDIDFVINTIRFENKTESIKLIREKFNLTFEQSEYIYGLHLRQLNNDYINKEIEKLREIEKEIKKLQETNPKDIIIEDMKYYKKNFNSKRKTEIIDLEEVAEVEKEIKKEILSDLVDDNDYWITITKNHYIYKTNNKLQTVKGDTIEHQYKLSNPEDEVFTFTHSRNGYKLQIKDLPIYQGSGLGEYLPTLLNVKKDDVISYGIASKYYPNIIIVFETGRIVKISYESYRKGVNVFSNTHCDKYKLSYVQFLDKDKDLILIDDKGNENKINTKDIRITKSRKGSGQYIHQTRRNNIKTIK